VALGWIVSTPDGGVATIAVSHDAGRQFGAAVPVGDHDTLITAGGLAITVSEKADDRIFLAWPVARGGRSDIVFASSADRGRSFTKTLLMPPADVPRGARVTSVAIEPSGELHVLWLAGTRLLYGRTTGRPTLAVTRIDDRASACNIASVAAAAGTASIFWFRAFTARESEFAYVRVGGAGPGSPGPIVRVSREAWGFKGCPDAAPSLLVDSRGAIRFVFRATTPGGTSLFTDRSADGRTFRPRTYIDTPAFAAAEHPQLAADRDGGLTLAWDGMRNGRRYVMIRHSLGAPGGQGGLDGDWMRPAPPVVLDASGAGASPVVVPTAQGLVAAWTVIGTRASRVAAIQMTVDELCGLPAAVTAKGAAGRRP
jgi:hypothetical protein